MPSNKPLSSYEYRLLKCSNEFFEVFYVGFKKTIPEIADADFLDFRDFCSDVSYSLALQAVVFPELPFDFVGPIESAFSEWCIEIGPSQLELAIDYLTDGLTAVYERWIEDAEDSED